MIIDSVPCNFEHRGTRFHALVTGETKVRITDTISGSVAILDEDSAISFNEDIEDRDRSGIENICRIYFEEACGE
jgi:hypothetical protein